MAADQKEILRRLEAGEPPSQVAMTMQVTVSTVYRVRRSAGMMTEHDNARVARETRAEQAPRVREMLDRGMSPTQVCADLEIGYDTFRKIVSEHGIEVTKGRTGRPTLKGKLFPEARRLHDDGKSQTEISKEIGVPLGTLSRWFHEEDIRIYRIDRDPHRDKSGNFGSTPEERSAAASAEGKTAAENLEDRTCDYPPCSQVFTRGRTGSGRMTRDRYCSPEHFYAHRREESGATTTYTCGFCGKEFQWWTRQPRKYCSQEHYMKANKGVPKYGFSGHVLESGYEAAFIGLCSVRGIPFEFFDRIEAVEWAPGGWYGPDFVIRNGDSLYIDTKGWKEAPQKWRAFRQQRGLLAIIRKEDLDELFLLPTAAGVLAAVKAKAEQGASLRMPRQRLRRVDPGPARPGLLPGQPLPQDLHRRHLVLVLAHQHLRLDPALPPRVDQVGKPAHLAQVGHRLRRPRVVRDVAVALVEDRRPVARVPDHLADLALHLDLLGLRENELLAEVLDFPQDLGQVRASHGLHITAFLDNISA